ncbi:MAG TPA: class II aldolase/adducin family protein [Acidimicrobiia bacterium]|nr:class II aldolase/adducin family protein [Acidimicrobiia bacterium]
MTQRVPLMRNDDKDPRHLVALGCRVLGAADLGDLIWGHLSLRDPEGRGVWIKGATLGFEEVGPDDVLLLSWDGEVLRGSGRRHAEYSIHTEVMRARPDVSAVVHAHAPHAVALASTGLPLRPISHEATLFVPPDMARFTKTGDLILTPELGAEVAAALGDRNALLLRHHGVVVAGATVEETVVSTILLERACAMQIRALSAGDIVTWSSDEEALSKRSNCYSSELLLQAWAYLVRRLAQSGG